MFPLTELAASQLANLNAVAHLNRFTSALSFLSWEEGSRGGRENPSNPIATPPCMAVTQHFNENLIPSQTVETFSLAIGCPPALMSLPPAVSQTHVCVTANHTPTQHPIASLDFISPYRKQFSIPIPSITNTLEGQFKTQTAH